MRRLPILIAFLALAAATAGLAETPIEKKAPAAADGLVSVTNIAGQVTVTGWDQAQVEVKGTLAEKLKLKFETSGNQTRIEVEYPRFTSTHGGADLSIRVPKGSSLEVQTVSADIAVKGVKGEISLQSVSGDLDAEGGDSDLELQTVSGEIGARGLQGIKKGELQTVSGDLELAGPYGKTSKIEADSVSGNVTLRGAAGWGAFWKLNTFSGSIECRICPAETDREEDRGPGREEDFTTHGGGARVIINTFSGDISLL